MAAATMSVTAFNLRTQASHPLRLGTSITKPLTSSRFSSVRFNHKPKISDPEYSTCSIIPTEAKDALQLSLKDGNDRYTYVGKQAQDTDSYVLLLDGENATLERLNTSLVFNLTGTPSENDAKILGEQHAQLSLEDRLDGSSLSGEDGKDAAPDPSNPFDYRHFLKSAAEANATPAAPRSTAGTPMHNAKMASSNNTLLARAVKPTAAPAPQKRKRPAEAFNHSAQQKRAKASTASAATKTTQKSNVPAVRVDRKASIRRPSLDDSGELILEDEAPASTKPVKPQSSLALALTGQLGPGPISLRSAASSPGMIASPAPKPPEHVEEDEEFELGGGSPEAHDYRPKSPEADMDADADADEDDDADVEELELPSPRQTHQPSLSNTVVTAGDEDDDLEKQLRMAMAEDEDGGVAAEPAVHAESDEESEEE